MICIVFYTTSRFLPHWIFLALPEMSWTKRFRFSANANYIRKRGSPYIIHVCTEPKFNRTIMMGEVLTKSQASFFLVWYVGEVKTWSSLYRIWPSKIINSMPPLFIFSPQLKKNISMCKKWTKVEIPLFALHAILDCTAFLII